MPSDVPPTGFEGGALNGKVQPDAVVAIVGAGPIGLAAMPTARFHSRSEILIEV